MCSPVHTILCKVQGGPIQSCPSMGWAPAPTTAAVAADFPAAKFEKPFLVPLPVQIPSWFLWISDSVLSLVFQLLPFGAWQTSSEASVGKKLKKKVVVSFPGWLQRLNRMFIRHIQENNCMRGPSCEGAGLAHLLGYL